jgi:hypothetical protein
MGRRLCVLLALGAVLLVAADVPVWTSKPISQWDSDDAQKVLDESGWVKSVTLQQVRNLSSDERRGGGDWDAGIGPGVGLAGTGIFGPEREAAALGRAHEKPNLGNVMVRWESALPIREAQIKLGLRGASDRKDDYYAIAVYNIAAPTRWNAANELKGVAYLRRDKKKDLKPERVEITRHEDGLATVVYLFRRSEEITRKDRNIQFVAQIGRLFVAQFFFTEDMEFQGRLEL